MTARYRRYDGDVPGQGGIALGHELGADSEFVVVFSHRHTNQNIEYV